jgi:uncharacterized membrane protein YkvA (DUF1232 family)
VGEVACFCYSRFGVPDLNKKEQQPMEWFEIIIQQLMLTWRLMTDRRVSIIPKIVFFLPFVYLISPIDLIPDLIPVLGQMDDFALLVAGFKLLETMSPGGIVAEHREAIWLRRGVKVKNSGANTSNSYNAYTQPDDVIDAEYRPINEKTKRKNDFPA